MQLLAVWRFGEDSLWTFSQGTGFLFRCKLRPLKNGQAVRLEWTPQVFNIDDLLDLDDALSTACSEELWWLYHIHLYIQSSIL